MQPLDLGPAPRLARGAGVVHVQPVIQQIVVEQAEHLGGERGGVVKNLLQGAGCVLRVAEDHAHVRRGGHDEHPELEGVGVTNRGVIIRLDHHERLAVQAADGPQPIGDRFENSIGGVADDVQRRPAWAGVTTANTVLARAGQAGRRVPGDHRVRMTVHRLLKPKVMQPPGQALALEQSGKGGLAAEPWSADQ